MWEPLLTFLSLRMKQERQIDSREEWQELAKRGGTGSEGFREQDDSPLDGMA